MRHGTSRIPGTRRLPSKAPKCETFAGAAAWATPESLTPAAAERVGSRATELGGSQDPAEHGRSVRHVMTLTAHCVCGRIHALLSQLRGHCCSSFPFAWRRCSSSPPRQSAERQESFPARRLERIRGRPLPPAQCRVRGLVCSRVPALLFALTSILFMRARRIAPELRLPATGPIARQQRPDRGPRR
jgi:hypothetical protein